MSEIKHYGTPRHSGRYPWGSGDDSYQRGIDFKTHIQELKKSGLSLTEIAKLEGISTTQLRARISIASRDKRLGDRNQVMALHDHGYSPTEIGRKMGINESSVRSLLNPVLAERANIVKVTVDMLKKEVDEKRYIDVGAGVESHIGVSRTKLNNAVSELKEQGYKIHQVNVDQLGLPGQFTIMKVLGAPDTEWKEVVKDVSQIKTISAISKNFGRDYKQEDNTIHSVNSNRIKVNFKEEGGHLKDGIIELRRGVTDLNLGSAKYAQVRIAVDDTHFLKGMAVYADKMPDGIDIMFNTNKSETVGKMGSMKPMNKIKKGSDIVDLNNPFKATIKIGGKRGALNIVNEEGDWDEWSKNISSQVLSKQSVPLAKQQLGLSLKQKQQEFDEINSLTNPVVKKHLLAAFSDDCDSSSVHLKAAALPRQASKVILPLLGVKENEVYAPSFKNGETVVLIRHPHGGIFEIPQVTVNNKSKTAASIMGNARDAIGIHPTTAQKLSGADFDGDTVIVIPNNNKLIRTSTSLKNLQNFDPLIYKLPEGSDVKPINPKTKQVKMGEASNLITDMTIKGASLDKIARAVRHSMVVIDSEKHNLDYRQSYKDHGIAALAKEYQNSANGGASTLISRAASKVYIPQIKLRGAKEGGSTDPLTGEKRYVETGEQYTNKEGKIIIKMTKLSRMELVKDAHLLSSGRPIEMVYADYANNLKNLGNTSRKIVLETENFKYSPTAKQVYAKEVSSLNAQLNIALKNKPIERQAQTVANTLVDRQKKNNPGMEKDDLKKFKNQALAKGRAITGAKKDMIEISNKEWEAIQAGAISPSKLSQILQNTNLDKIKQLATPRIKEIVNSTKINKAKMMLEAGYTQSEVAETLGVSVSTLNKGL